MDDNATPTRRRRPVQYPAAIPRTMTTEAQRAELDRIAARDGRTLGQTVRYLLAAGIASDAETPPS